MNKKSSIKEKLNILGGVLIVGFLLFGLARSVYNRNFADGKLHVIQEASGQISPIKHALFWHEQELEKLSGNHALSLEETYFIKPLYTSLEATGLVSEELQTMSDKALHRMIELGAYSGEQTDVWALAQYNGPGRPQAELYLTIYDYAKGQIAESIHLKHINAISGAYYFAQYQKILHAS